MDMDREIIRGLTSNPKFMPYLYNYDAIGEELYLHVHDKSKYYYWPRYEKRLLQENVKVSIN